ncbi:hypothetical protein [Bartonella gliris]|uniref:hypothetical protein n=1 Tax=Bartonella gliris TaxID=3004109 RepID=UPI003873857D
MQRGFLVAAISGKECVVSLHCFLSMVFTLRLLFHACCMRAKNPLPVKLTTLFGGKVLDKGRCAGRGAGAGCSGCVGFGAGAVSYLLN